MPSHVDYRAWTRLLVTGLKQSQKLRNYSVERAFLAVPRHLFVEDFHLTSSDWSNQSLVRHNPDHPQAEHLDLIYDDRALITRWIGDSGTSSTSQPSVVAESLGFLELERGMRVLEIGTGTGYNAALLSEIVGSPGLVTSIDIQPEVISAAGRALARAGYSGVRIIVGDGFDGAPAILRLTESLLLWGVRTSLPGGLSN